MAITGRAVALVALGLVPVLLFPSWAILLWWQAGVAALGVVDFALGRHEQLQARRHVSVAVRLGQEAQCKLELFNPGKRPLRALVRDAWGPSVGGGSRATVTVGAGRGTRIRTRLEPQRRGVFKAAEVTVRVPGPLGLVCHQYSLAAPAALRVLPAFTSRRHLPSRLARLRELDGRTLTMRGGQGTEFDSLREYVPGDDVRTIDWRATARSRNAMVRTFRPERNRQVLIVLDSSRYSGTRLGNITRLDASMEAALLLTALASHASDDVRLLVVDSKVRARVHGGGNTRLHAVATALADVQPELMEGNYGEVLREVTRTLPHRSLVVVLSAIEPSLSAGMLDMVSALTAKHVVVVAGATASEEAQLRDDRSSLLSTYVAAAAESAELEREASRYQLSKRGAHLVEDTAERLAPALADKYLALKAAGQL
ncbi:DUF58 domain-containing protein [Buchananella felis]|uniref:DUF58 domain-containing protein n=1 Tax=Buchananella felis TaxID=3231492 RepID=UPI0035292357